MTYNVFGGTLSLTQSIKCIPLCLSAIINNNIVILTKTITDNNSSNNQRSGHVNADKLEY